MCSDCFIFPGDALDPQQGAHEQTFLILVFFCVQSKDN